MVTFVHNHPEDYFYFLHLMRQGYDGAWAVTSRMTPETFPPQFVAPFFPILGKLGHIVPLGMGELYTLARMVGGVALLVMIWKLAATLFSGRRTRVWAFVLTVMGSFLPDVQNGTIVIPTLVRLTWTELDPLMRLSFVPHHLWSKVLMLSIFILFLKNRSPILIAFLTVLMGFTSPVILVTFLLTITLWMLVEKQKQVLSYALIVLSVGGVSLYHWQIAHSVFPWTTYGPPWETNWLYVISVWQYLQSFGVLFPVAIFGIAAGFRHSRAIRLLTAWIVSGWFLIFVFRPLLPFSVSRYLAGYQWIAVGILAAEGIRRFKYSGVIAFVLVLLAVPSWVLSIDKRIEYIQKNTHNPQVFMRPDIRATLHFLSYEESPCRVAAPDWFSTMIPAYSSCRSVSGHRLMTWANDIKVYEMNEFFFQPVPLEKKAARIKQYGITHVITLEGITGTDILPLLAPTPAFTSGGVRVYETR